MDCQPQEGSTMVGVSLLVIIIGLTVGLTLMLCGCTMSMSNISTHGQASDVVDEQQEASPDISPTLSIPAL